MRHIAFPFRAGISAILMRTLRITQALAILLVSLLSIAGATASTSPRSGGILRVQISEHVATIDPRQRPQDSMTAATTERLASLVFDRLSRFDEHGSVQPALATSWEHDPKAKRWKFHLRQGVKFSDGTPLSAEVAVLALRQLLGNDFDVSSTADSVVVQADHSLPNFPAQLAAGRYFIFDSAADGTLSGTGPFRVTERPAKGAPTKLVFAANESCWAGRPFVDKIEFTMGVDSQQQANAIAFGQADVVDLSASQVRRVGQRGVRTASSDPVELFALQFDMSRTEVKDARLRESISLAIDRASISDVVLQRQGLPAGGLLPNWLSGYGFLFPIAVELPRAKELLMATGREVSRSAPLVLVYDSGDAEARAVADRVAVNLKEARIAVQVSGQTSDGKMKASGADMRLVRERISSPDISVALPALLASFGEPSPAAETPEQAYPAERAPIDAFRIIPIVHVSESYGLSPRVRDWMTPRWGGWRLEDVWLEQAPAAGGTTP